MRPGMPVETMRRPVPSVMVPAMVRSEPMLVPTTMAMVPETVSVPSERK